MSFGTSYLIDDEAVDVSRMTDLPWGWWKIDQHGVRRPVLLLEELDWWDRWRVLWARVGGWYLLDSANDGSYT